MNKNPIFAIAQHNSSNNFAYKEIYDENGLRLVGVYCLTILQIQIKYLETFAIEKTGVLCCSLFQNFVEENGRMIKRFSPLMFVDLNGVKKSEKVYNCPKIPNLSFADKKGNVLSLRFLYYNFTIQDQTYFRFVILDSNF